MTSAAELLRMTSAAWVAQAIAVAAKLRLADLLEDGPKSFDELAAETATHPPSLYRLLRALASVGIFAENGEGRFELTPLATPLQSDVPGSVRAMCAMRGEPWFWGAWGDLLHCVTTGESAFEHRHGKGLFELLSGDPAAMSLFAEAMTSMSETESAAVLAAHDFSAAKTVVDVGGGQGFLLAAILQANPSLRGVLFDLPDTVTRAHRVFESAGVRDRLEVIGGSFFDAVPAGGDAYMLKSVIHDWDDDRAVAILANCRRAMTTSGTLLLIERVIPSGNEPSVAKWMDVNMLVATGGRERTEAEYRSLYASAGFELTRITATAAYMSLIEGKPSDQQM
jgi:predicted O-methyltransferase YrrM